MNHRGTAVSTVDGDRCVVRVRAGKGNSEAHSAHDVEGCYTKNVFEVVYARLEERGCDDGDGGVDGVGDDKDVCFRGHTADCACEVVHDGGVYLWMVSTCDVSICVIGLH